MPKKTEADVFIIETLDPDDEGNGRFEGTNIVHVLKLHDKNPIYRYVRTRDQFLSAINEFKKSHYRYLHLSAHADADGPCTTNQDEISYDDLTEMLKGVIDSKRFFVSACEMVHERMAKSLILKADCLSVVGPNEEITFADAAVFWPAIYHLLFSKSDQSISHSDLKQGLKAAAKLFDVGISYYSRSKKSKRGYTRDLLRKN